MVDKTIPDLDAVATPVITDISNVRQVADTEDRRITRAQQRQLLVGEQLDGTNSQSGAVLNVAATSQVPTIVPSKADPDTGLGRSDPDALALISGGALAMRLSLLNAGVIQGPAADTSVTAFATGGQGGATPLINSYSVVDVCAAEGDSVLLPAVFVVNSLMYVKNDGAEACDVFPASGDDLGEGGDVALSVLPGLSATFIATIANSTWTQLIVAPAAMPLLVETITADNVSQTQASGTTFSSRLVTVISANDNDSITLPSVFAVNSIVEINMPDDDDDDATCAVFPASGDDLGEGVDTAFTLRPHENVMFRATTADSVWARVSRGASSVSPWGSLDGGGVRDVTSEINEPTLNPRASQPGDGIGSDNPGVIGIICNNVEGIIYVNNGTGVIRSEPNRGKAITAFATGGQGSAVELLETYNVVTVVGTAGDSVRLPTTFFERAVIWVSNADATEAMDLFPASGGDLGQGLNAALSIPAGESAYFINAGSTTWRQLTFVPKRLLGSVSTGPEILDQTPTSSDPNIRPNQADVNSGIGSRSADEISIITGGVEAVRWVELNGGVLQGLKAGLGLTAFATGGQVSALPLEDTHNVVTTVGTAGDSIRLPVVFAIDAVIHVKNDGANALDLFPASGDDLGSGTDVAVSVQPGLSVSFIATSANSTWTPLLNLQGTEYTTQGNFLIATHNFQTITADNVSQTQASGTLIQSSQVRVISLNDDDSVTLPAVFPVNTIIEINMPDIDEDEASAAIFPASGDDLGNGTDVVYTLPFGKSVTFIATAANTTWERMRVGATHVQSVFATGPEIIDLAANGDPLISIRRDEQYGWGSEDANTINLIMGGVQVDRHLHDAIGGNGVQTSHGQQVISAFATGGQAMGTLLVSSYTRIATVTSPGDSIKLPSVFSDMTRMAIYNAGANPADIFPFLGDDLGAGTNVAVSIPVGAVFEFLGVGGSALWVQTDLTTHLLATNAAGPQVVDEAATATNPTLIPNQAEIDTGIGWVSADLMALIVGGSHEFSISANGLESEDANGPGIFNEAASATNPTLLPDRADPDTGIGQFGDDELSLIAGAHEGLRMTEASDIMTFDFDAGDNQAEQVGALTSLKSVSVSIPGVAAATLTASSIIPAGAFVVGITGRIETTYGNGSGLTAFNIGDGVTATRWGTSIALTGDTTVDPTDADANIAFGHFPAANDIVLTSITGDFEAVGTMDIIVHYFMLTPATA